MTNSYTLNEYKALGAEVRKQILGQYTRDSCIATVRATLDILKAVGIESYALSCRAVVVNEPLYRWAVLHDGQYPRAGSEEYPEHGYGIGVGINQDGEPSTERWAGHLVAIAERKWLLDFSLDQATRLEHGIDLREPLVIQVTEPFLRGRDQPCYKMGNVFIYYTALPGDDRFKSSPNWSGETRPHVQVQAAKERKVDRRTVARSRREVLKR